MKKSIYDLKEGDRIKILKRPTYWSSHFSNKCPIHADLTFPLSIIIEKIEEDHMLCDRGYGWTLDGISRRGWEFLSGEGEGEHFLGFI